MTTNLSEKNDHGLLIELLKETQINGEYLKGIHTLLSDLKFLLDGFTNQGASINGYVPDIGTLAYLAVVGPTLARKLEKTVGVEEILVAAEVVGRANIQRVTKTWVHIAPR